jgi:hypothetical protein
MPGEETIIGDQQATEFNNSADFLEFIGSLDGVIVRASGCRVSDDIQDSTLQAKTSIKTLGKITASTLSAPTIVMRGKVEGVFIKNCEQLQWLRYDSSQSEDIKLKKNFIYSLENNAEEPSLRKVNTAGLDAYALGLFKRLGLELSSKRPAVGFKT